MRKRSDYDVCPKCGNSKCKVVASCRSCWIKSRERDPKERFFEKIEKTKSCWFWRGTINNVWGYGQFFVNGVYIRAHRYSYEIHKGEIPPGLYICHSCDNTNCVNPDHLWAGTQKENIRDCMRKARKQAAPVMVGENNPIAKLCNNDVRLIRKMYLTGKYSQTTLSHKFKVSQAVISSVIRRNRWAHVF